MLSCAAASLDMTFLGGRGEGGGGGGAAEVGDRDGGAAGVWRRRPAAAPLPDRAAAQSPPAPRPPPPTCRAHLEHGRRPRAERGVEGLARRRAVPGIMLRHRAGGARAARGRTAAAAAALAAGGPHWFLARSRRCRPLAGPRGAVDGRGCGWGAGGGRARCDCLRRDRLCVPSARRGPLAGPRPRGCRGPAPSRPRARPARTRAHI
jgi:hypothetical protein